MTWSFTAPATTAEEERRERESMNDDLRQSIQDDFYGRNQDLQSWLGYKETEEIRERGKQELQTALGGIEIKEEYEAAVERSPQLVEQESDAMSFLRFHKYDATAAANGIVEYWKVRKTVFGEELYCQPMTLEGAMSDYRDALNKCVFLWIPNADKHGRPVFFLDRIRLIPSIISREDTLRANFFLMQSMLASSKESCHRGYVLLTNLFGFDFYKHTDRIMAKQNLKIWNTFPLPVKANHFFLFFGFGCKHFYACC